MKWFERAWLALVFLAVAMMALIAFSGCTLNPFWVDGPAYVECVETTWTHWERVAGPPGYMVLVVDSATVDPPGCTPRATLAT